jgi:hypothetical protein
LDASRFPLADEWPFSEPGDARVITLERILQGGSAVRLVTHDEDEPRWQFLDGEHVFEDDAVVVLLGEMVQLDPSLIALAGLPVGTHAWRSGPEGGWVRGTGDPPVELPEASGPPRPEC